LLSVALLGLASCGYIGPSSGDDTTPPEFAGIVLAYSPYTDKIVLGWADATDNATKAENIKYRVYVGESPDAETLVRDDNLVDTVQDDGYTVSGLVANTTYYCLVAAVDEAGNINTENRSSSVKTLARDVSVSEDYVDTATMDIQVRAAGDDSYVLSGEDAAQVEVGSVLPIETLNEDGSTAYVLKKVVSREGATVTTENASLGDAISEGAFSSSAALIDLDALSGVEEEVVMDSPIEGYSAAGGAVGRTVTRTYTDPRGRFSIKESRKYAPAPDDAAVSSLMATGSKMKAEGVNFSDMDISWVWASDGIYLGYDIDVTAPIITTNAEWAWLWYGRYLKNAYGEVNADAKLFLGAVYKFDGSKSYSKSGIDLGLKREIDLFYSVGPIPVYQKITLELLADVNVNANADIWTGAYYGLEKELDFVWGYYNHAFDEYELDSDYYLAEEDGDFSQSMTFNLDFDGDLYGTVSVYPKVTSTFYKVYTNTAQIEPKVTLNASAETYPLDTNPNNIELTRFDADYSIGYYISADFGAFDTSLGGWGRGATLASGNLFSLPEISLSCPDTGVAEGETTTCSLSVADGVNNKVSSGTIQWWASDSSVQITPASDGMSATVKGVSAGSPTVYVSAYGSGFLSTLGKRYESAAMTVSHADSDGDGFTSETDCDDSDPDSYPLTYYQDEDGDGYSSGTSTTACPGGEPTGYYIGSSLTSTSGDCQDSNTCAYQYGGMCLWWSYGKDTVPSAYYRDADGDGYSDGTVAYACSGYQPAGYSLSSSLTATSGDCDDSSATYSPVTVWYRDADGDGYSDGTTASQCAQPSGYYISSALKAINGDLDDADAATTSLADGLVAWYAFGGDAADSSGNGNTGTVSGATLTTDRHGAANGAYSFDGVDDYISVADSNSLDLAGALTVAAWVKPADVTTNIHYEILRKNGSASGYLLAFQEYGAYLTLGINSNATYESDTPITASALTDGGWHFVAGTYDGADLKVYVDGVLVGTKAQTGAVGTNANSLFIGSSTGAYEFFEGALDEIMIYNKALTQTAITALSGL
jgi:hypothetical protein